MKKLYCVNWSTFEIETATLLDEHHINDGASVETWLCKDSKGRKFTCSKFGCGWRFSELAAWLAYEQLLEEQKELSFKSLLKTIQEYQDGVSAHLHAKQKIIELLLQKN